MTTGGRALHILHVEDDPFVASAIRRWLEDRDWCVQLAATAADALLLLESQDYDAILLDWNLKGTLSGIELCTQIRDILPNAWIAFLTVRDSEADRVRGLTVGADDYITKDSGIRELLARLEGLERRLSASQRPVRWGPFAVDPASDRAWVARTEVTLTPCQRRLLLLLIQNAGHIVSHTQVREDVLRTAAAGAKPSSSTRDLTYELRKRLGSAGRHIRTVARLGYTLTADQFAVSPPESSQSVAASGTPGPPDAAAGKPALGMRASPPSVLVEVSRGESFCRRNR